MFDRKEYMRGYLKQYMPGYYREHKEHTIEQVEKTRTIRRHAKKQRAVDMFGGKCEKCGYNKCIAALEFHHKDPTKKGISANKMWTMKWETIAKEIKKCSLLCSNCHREAHWARGQTG